MAKNPVLPLYYNDINSSTEHWSDEEFGAYMRLLIHQWDKGFIPDDHTRLRRIADTAKKHWKILKQKFVKGEDGLLRNTRMEEVREDRIKHTNKQKENIRKRYQTSTKLPTKEATKTLPLEVEEEKEKNLGKSENPLPAIGMQVTREVANEAWNDQAWRENFCMAFSIEEKELKKWMAQFNTSISNDYVNDFNPSRYKKIFRGWLNKERSKGTTVMHDSSEQAAIPKRLQNLNS